jgi:pimeloyl-ACP methyl ester carboxylesterase
MKRNRLLLSVLAFLLLTVPAGANAATRDRPEPIVIQEQGSFFAGGTVDVESLAQFFRQGTPNIGTLDADVISDAMSAVFDKAGPGIFVTHSMGGSTGWETAIKNKNVRAIVAYEPGGTPFLFPVGEVPAPTSTSYGLTEAKGIPLEDFKALAKIPIIIYYGDNIAEEPTDDFGQDQWRAELRFARDFAKTLNRCGGDATIGISTAKAARYYCALPVLAGINLWILSRPFH